MIDSLCNRHSLNYIIAWNAMHISDRWISPHTSGPFLCHDVYYAIAVNFVGTRNTHSCIWRKFTVTAEQQFMIKLLNAWLLNDNTDGLRMEILGHKMQLCLQINTCRLCRIFIRYIICCHWMVYGYTEWNWHIHKYTLCLLVWLNCLDGARKGGISLSNESKIILPRLLLCDRFEQSSLMACVLLHVKGLLLLWL